MPTTTAARTPFLASIDDYLGPALGRFFGSGYRRVTYRLDSLERTAGGADLLAHVAIGYPTDWSTKATAATLRPHLSTVDALVLGARVGALALAGTPGLDAEGRRSAWLRRVEIRAASTPQEQGLDRLPVTATRAGTTADHAGHATTCVDTRVGGMRVRLDFAHPVAEGATESATLTALAAETRRGPYGDAFAAQRQTVRDVELDLEASRAAATVAVLPLGWSDDTPLLTMVDSFVVALQLGQVLLYELDGVERARSNNLWMRSTTLTADAAPRPVTGPLVATAELADRRVLRKSGAAWRTATVVGDLAGVRTRCAVAHELPALTALAA